MANFFSGRTAYTQICFKNGQHEETLATGSGFFVRRNGIACFISARHNVTGRHWETEECLSPTLALPTHLLINVPIVETVPNSGRFGWHQMFLPLSAEGRNTWIELQTERGVADIIGLPCPTLSEDEIVARWKARNNVTGNFVIGCVNEKDPWEDTVSRHFNVGAPSYVLGYPLGLTGGGENRPIWRSGTIATEPKDDFQGWPAFLVDCAGRNGLSGAPVIAEDAQRFRRLAGVYTGRVGSGNESSDLGYVWKVSCVEQLLSQLR